MPGLRTLIPRVRQNRAHVALDSEPHSNRTGTERGRGHSRVRSSIRSRLGQRLLLVRRVAYIEDRGLAECADAGRPCRLRALPLRAEVAPMPARRPAKRSVKK